MKQPANEKLKLLRSANAVLKCKSSILPILESALVWNGVIELTDLADHVIIKNAATKQDPFLLDIKQLIAATGYFTDPVITVQDHSVKFADLFSELTFKTDKHDQFPKYPEVFESKKGTLLISDLEVISAARSFTSQDELRPSMTGIYLNNMYAVSTDAHLLYFDKIQSDIHNAIVRTSFVRLLEVFRKGGDYQLNYNTHRIQAENNLVKINSRLIDEKYPDWEKVLPNQATTTFQLPKEELLKDLTFALSMGIHDSRISIAIHNGSVSISAVNIDGSNSTFSKKYEDVPCTGEELKIFFNGHYLTKAVRAVNDPTISFELTTFNRSAVLNEKVLVMPLMPGHDW